jgi:hypothetical protein
VLLLLFVAVSDDGRGGGGEYRVEKECEYVSARGGCRLLSSLCRVRVTERRKTLLSADMAMRLRKKTQFN